MNVEVFDGVASVALGDTLLTLWQRPARSERIRHVTGVASRLLERAPGGGAPVALLCFSIPTPAD